MKFNKLNTILLISFLNIYSKELINKKLLAINNWLLDSNMLYGKEY